MNNLKKRLYLLLKNKDFVLKGLFLVALILFTVVITPQITQSAMNSGYGYGYSSGTYGYGFQYSDYPPSAPTSLSSSSVADNSATISWTAPTTTTGSTLIATGSGSISSYNINYSTSSLSACSGGTSTTSTTASKALTSLNTGATYYVAVCAVDNNSNTSSALTGSFTTTGGGGGGGGGGGITTYTPVEEVTPTPITVTPTPTAVTPEVTIPTDAAAAAAIVGVERNLAAEQSAAALVTTYLDEVGMEAETTSQYYAMVNYVAYGNSAEAYKLGSGERLAVIQDFVNTMVALPKSQCNWSDIQRIITGQKPICRNLKREQEQLPHVLYLFEKIYGKRPVWANANENLAWNYMMYRIRPVKRVLAQEAAAITIFKSKIGRVPATKAGWVRYDWAAVKAIAYALKP